MRLPRDLEAKVLALAINPPKPAKRLTEPPAGDAMPLDLTLLVAAVRAEGFPDPVPEHRFHPTRKWRFDLAWPTLMVAFEREGGAWVKSKCECGRVRTIFKSRHHDRDGMEEDSAKYNAAAVLGWTVIRGTPGMIKSGVALAALLDALTAKTQRRAA